MTAAEGARRGRPVLGAISGFVFGLFLGIELWVLGVVSLGNILLTILPVLGLALGLTLGITHPLGRGAKPSEPAPPERSDAAEPDPAAPAPPPPPPSPPPEDQG